MNDWWVAHEVEKALAANEETDIEEARRRKLAAEAELAELELAKARGLVIEVAAVEARWETAWLRVRQKLTARPAFEAPRLVGRTEKEIRAELTRYNLDIFAEVRGDKDKAA